MRKRIWELDVLRGIFLILIMAFHFWYDLIYLFGLATLSTPFEKGLYSLFNNFGGTPFLLISGLCATLGSHPMKRGLQVIGGGIVIFLVTLGMYLLDFADRGIIIYFGVLHCIGTCMLLWPLFKKLPTGWLLILGIPMVAVGLYLRNHVTVDFPWLIPLGLVSRGFASADYFPLLPNLGYFLIGAAAGRVFYKKKETLFPSVSPNNSLVRFFSFFGKNSLLFYLLHQPVMAGILTLYTMLL